MPQHYLENIILVKKNRICLPSCLQEKKIVNIARNLKFSLLTEHLNLALIFFHTIIVYMHIILYVVVKMYYILYYIRSSEMFKLIHQYFMENNINITENIHLKSLQILK